MQTLRKGAKINIALEQMGIVRLRHGKEHVMGTSLLYPTEVGWAQDFVPRDQVPQERHRSGQWGKSRCLERAKQFSIIWEMHSYAV